LLGADDARVVLQALLVDDERPVQERLDVGRADRGDRLAIERLRAHARPEPFGGQAAGTARGVGAAAAADPAAEPQPRRRAALVQVDDVARIDPVRILDLLAIELPDFGPAPRL